MIAIAVARRALAFGACVAPHDYFRRCVSKTNVWIEGDTLLIHVPSARWQGPQTTQMKVDMQKAPCAYQILHPAVLMMKSAEDRPFGDLAVPLDQPIARRILTQ